MDLSYLKKNDFKIFVDTSALLEPKFLDYVESISDNLSSKGTGLILTQDVVKELKGHSNNPNLIDKVSSAKNFIERCIKKNIMKPISMKNYADNSFLGLFTFYRTEHNLVLITTDNNLSEEILDLNQSKAVAFLKEIRVFNLDKKGNPYQRAISHRTIDEILPKQAIPFKKARTVIDQSLFNSIDLDYIPTSGDRVIADNGNGYKLGKKIAEGGEGAIYQFSQIKSQYRKSNYDPKNCLIKIYHKNIVNQARIEKLKLMINNKSLEIDGVCFPLAIINNDHNEIVGFIMQKAGQGQQTHDLQRSIMIRPLLEDLFPGWKKSNLVAVCLNIVNTINAIHKYNILLGDINEQNILVDANSRVYFIDTDSYQIENYPCPVGSATFTHPDILRKNYKTFLRKIEHERFAVATLLFKILLPGFPPYSYQGGSNPAANVKKRKFVFPYYDNRRKIHHESDQLAENSIWAMIWHNLPNNMREAFYFTFAKGEIREINDPIVKDNNLKDTESNHSYYDKKKLGWTNLLSLYKYELEKGYHKNDLFPNSRKIKSNFDIDRRIVKCLLMNESQQLQEIRKDTGAMISVIQDDHKGNRLDNPFVKLIGLDQECIDTVTETIRNIKEKPLFSKSKLFTVTDFLSIEKTTAIMANKITSNLIGPKGKYINEAKKAYKKFKIITIKSSDKSSEFITNDIQDFVEKKGEELGRKVDACILIGGDRESDIEKGYNRLLEYYKNEVLDVIQIPKDVNISEFIGPQGKSLKKLCIDIGINAQDINLDTVNKFILIKHKGAKDYKSLIVNKLDAARFKPFDFQKTVFYKKLLMRHFCSKKFTNALDLKLGIKRNEDYYLDNQVLEDSFNRNIKASITIHANTEELIRKLLLILDDCSKWSFYDKISIPKSIHHIIEGDKGYHFYRILEKTKLNNPLTSRAEIMIAGNNLSYIVVASKTKINFDNFRRTIARSVKILLSSKNEKMNIKKFKEKILS